MRCAASATDSRAESMTSSGASSRLVRHVEAGHGRAWLTGALVDAARGIVARAAALAFPGDLQRALDLDLGEAGDGRAGEIPPGAAVGGRVDDDGDAASVSSLATQQSARYDDIALDCRCSAAAASGFF